MSSVDYTCLNRILERYSDRMYIHTNSSQIESYTIKQIRKLSRSIPENLIRHKKCIAEIKVVLSNRQSTNSKLYERYNLHIEIENIITKLRVKIKRLSYCKYDSQNRRKLISTCTNLQREIETLE